MDRDGSLDTLLLYGREGCHLCDDAHEVLTALLERRSGAGLAAPAIRVVDIDDDAAAHDAFHATIPVIAWGDRRLELATSAGAIGRFLEEALDQHGPAVLPAEDRGGVR